MKKSIRDNEKYKMHNLRREREPENLMLEANSCDEEDEKFKGLVLNGINGMESPGQDPTLVTLQPV